MLLAYLILLVISVINYNVVRRISTRASSGATIVITVLHALLLVSNPWAYLGMTAIFITAISPYIILAIIHNRNKAVVSRR